MNYKWYIELKKIHFIMFNLSDLSSAAVTNTAIIERQNRYDGHEIDNTSTEEVNVQRRTLNEKEAETQVTDIATSTDDVTNHQEQQHTVILDNSNSGTNALESDAYDTLHINEAEMYKIGDLVDVDGKNIGYITDVCNRNENGHFTVRYIIDKRTDYGISSSRLKLRTLNSDTCTRAGTNRREPQQQANWITATNDDTAEQQEFKAALENSFSSKKYTSENPLYKFLLQNKSKSKGWLRNIIRKKTVNPKSHLNPLERTLLTVVSTMFSGYSPCQGVLKGYCDLINRAFGVARNTHNNILTFFVNSSYTMERKQRNDKYKSVFNCEERRKKVFTGYNVFKKRKTKEFRDNNTRISEIEYASAFEELSVEQKRSYEVLAQRQLDRSRYLWEDLKKVLLKTKGKISFRELENQLDNIVSHQTIMNFLNTQEGFTLKKDRIIPSLDLNAKERRVEWAETWWTFWKCVKCIPTDKAIVVNIHMDEKWFYAVKARTNIKELTSIGLENNYSKVHHKNNIQKTMYIVVTAYVPMIDNDITKGGKAVPISCYRCVKMVKQSKDSYKRVYKDDGSFHYPKIPENLLNKKGHWYSQNVELTGCSEGTAKEPKLSLLQVYKDEIIPSIHQKIVERFSNNGTRDVIIVKQEDGAGLHTKAKYVHEMNEMFAERGWVIFNQPSQSPMTNVHDACIFPMMSKAASTVSAVDYEARLLQGEQLHEVVMKVWNNPKHRVAMSRAFAGHSQIVSAILAHNGDNTYLTERKGLSFGIRKMFVRDREGDGIIPVVLAPENEGETSQGILLSEWSVNGLRYEPPDITSLSNAKLSAEMRGLFVKYADPDLMSDEVCEVLMPIIHDELMVQTMEEYQPGRSRSDPVNVDDMEVTMADSEFEEPVPV